MLNLSPVPRYLARISRHLTAKVRDRCATTSLRSIVVLNGLSSTPPRADRRPPRIDAPLTHLRSPRGENCGLAPRVAASILLVLCLGCDDVVSTSPLIGPAQRVRDDRLAGRWVDADSQDTFQFELLSDGRYRYSDTDADDEGVFSLGRVAGTLILQWEQESCSLHLFFSANDEQRCYSFAKLEFDDRSFSLTELDIERAFRDSVAGRLEIEHEIRREVPAEHRKPQTCVVLTAATEQLRPFFEIYIDDEEVFKKTKQVFFRTGL